MSLNQVAYDYIRRLLTSGRVGVNTSISEPELARELGISRTPVREAMKQLAREGMIEQFHGVGTFLRVPDRSELVHMLELRETIEVAAARRAAERRTAKDLEVLKKQQQRMSAGAKQIRQKKLTVMPPDVLTEMVDADQIFHHTIVAAAQNPLYTRSLDTFQVLARTMLPIPGQAERVDLADQVTRSEREHAAIADAIRAQDADAAGDAMGRHIQWAASVMLGNFDAGRPADPDAPAPRAEPRRRRPRGDA